MIDVEAPVFKAGVDALLTANGVQIPGGLQQRTLPGALAADDQGLLAVVQVFVVMAVGQVPQVQAGAVVVDQVIAIVAEKLLVVIQAGDGEAAVEQVRAAVVQVRRVHGFFLRSLDFSRLDEPSLKA